MYRLFLYVDSSDTRSLWRAKGDKKSPLLSNVSSISARCSVPYLMGLMSWNVADEPLLRGRDDLCMSAMIARDGHPAGPFLSAEFARSVWTQLISDEGVPHQRIGGRDLK